MEKQQESFMQAVPPSATGILERAFRRIGGRANAIKAKCLECSGFVRDDVRNCTVLVCPLHPWRPFQLKPGATEGVEQQDDFDPDLDGDADPIDEDDEL